MTEWIQIDFRQEECGWAEVGTFVLKAKSLADELP